MKVSKIQRYWHNYSVSLIQLFEYFETTFRFNTDCILKMIFFLFFSLINLIQETTLKTCQNNNAFTIKKFEFSYPHVIRAKKITYNIFAEISSHVENPFLETQIIPEEGRIPIFRIDDSLCRKSCRINNLAAPRTLTYITVNKERTDGYHFPAVLSFKHSIFCSAPPPDGRHRTSLSISASQSSLWHYAARPQK